MSAEAEELLTRLLNEVVYLSSNGSEVTDYESYKTMPITPEEFEYLRGLRDRDGERS